MAWLACAFSSIRARCPEKPRRRDLMTDGSVSTALHEFSTLYVCDFFTSGSDMAAREER